jgi:predicted MFS family arabinose efflux permease
MLILAFFHVGNGYSMVGTALILNTIANKENFDFSDAEKSTYLGLIVSLYLLGYGVSTLTVGYFLKFSQRTVLIVFVIAYFLLNISLILPCIWLLLLGRFGLGCTFGVISVIIASN